MFIFSSNNGYNTPTCTLQNNGWNGYNENGNTSEPLHDSRVANELRGPNYTYSNNWKNPSFLEQNVANKAYFLTFKIIGSLFHQKI